MTDTKTSIDLVIAEYIRRRIIEYYKTLVWKKYRRYEQERDDNEVFVHEILSWYFDFKNDIDDNNPPGRILVGEAVDEYLKHAIPSTKPVLSVPVTVDGHTFIVTGKPDAIIEFGEYTLVIDFKFSRTLKQYHVTQAYLYALLAHLSGAEKVKCVVVTIRDDLTVFVFDPNYDFASELVKAYLRVRLQNPSR